MLEDLNNISITDERVEKINTTVLHPTENLAEDVALVRNQGMEVDDNDEPAPENTPKNSSCQQECTRALYPGQWGWGGIDQCEI